MDGAQVWDNDFGFFAFRYGTQVSNFIGNLVKISMYIGKLVKFFVHDLMSYSCS